MTNLSTFIVRATDSMILVATMDSAMEAEEYKTAAKRILKTLKPTSPARCTIDAGAYLYHYILESSVIYLCMAEKGYPRKLAYQYLEEVQREFSQSHGNDVYRYSRPYAAVNFERQLSKIRREYADPNSPASLKHLQGDLHSIHHIMSTNINEILQRGEKLDVMEDRSQALVAESKKFAKLSRYVNLQALYRTYGPIVAVVLVILVVLYIKLF